MARLILIGAVLLGACDAPSVDPAPEPEPVPASVPKHQLDWTDADSGELDGEPFRLADVDAPETGSVGSPRGALCEEERQKGFEAEAWMKRLTTGAEVRVTGEDGRDPYGRRVLSLSVNGEDVAQLGLAAGHLRSWSHNGSQHLEPKPDWCP